MSLARLLEQATPGPWEAEGPSSFHTAELRAPSPYNGFALIKVMTNRDADLALITRAPEMARLLIDMADFMRDAGFTRYGDDPGDDLLARFVELEQQAGR